MPEHNTALSRRSVIKGAAWSVPVIAAAVAVPTAAASDDLEDVKTWYLVESSDAVHDGDTRLSAPYLDDCEYDGVTRPTFNLVATLVYAGNNPDFTLEHTTVTAPAAWNVSSVVATRNLVTVTGQHTFGCREGVPGIHFDYNLPPEAAKPELYSLTVDITGVSTDGSVQIGGLVGAVHNYEPVVGPRDPNAPDETRGNMNK
ncbi:hypothetical protein [Microbacterium sp. YY-01]|uniref:hypothetical protein n=1 Tax=Microbacterium sp. YY-01 TaxID=3421634 RepID=UPI003D17E0FD